MGSNLELNQKTLSQARRLVVLVPDFNLDEAALGRRIWELALAYCKDVLLLGAVKNAGDDLRALHCMSALLACAQDRRIHIQTHLEFGVSWQKAIRNILKPGDLILCCPDHEIRRNLFQHTPLSSLLAQNIKAPVYVLPDCYQRVALSGKRNDRIPGKATNVL